MTLLHRLTIVACASAIALSGCSSPASDGSDGGTGGAAPSPSAESALSIVVLGDSVPFNSQDDCAGCTSYSQLYADALEEKTGQPVALSNLSRHDGAKTRDIGEQVLTDEPTRDALKDADVVIVSAGFNDQPPYDDPSRPCSFEGTDNTPVSVVIEAAAATTTDCIDEVVAATRDDLAIVLDTVASLAPDAEIGVMTQYNSWTGWSELSSSSPATVQAVNEAIVYGLLQWNAASCEEGAAVDASCIDVLPAFNGEGGTQAAGDLLAPDYTHPSQAGNDTIAELLVASGLGQ
jgi:lysophospholipase L1-like esterase